MCGQFDENDREFFALCEECEEREYFDNNGPKHTHTQRTQPAGVRAYILLRFSPTRCEYIYIQKVRILVLYIYRSIILCSSSV